MSSTICMGCGGARIGSDAQLDMPPVHKRKRLPEERKRHFIAEWRDSRGLTQEQLAEMVGVTHGTVSRIENRKSPYNQDFVEDVAKLFNCQPTDILNINPLAPDRLADAMQRFLSAAPAIQADLIGYIEWKTNEREGGAPMKSPDRPKPLPNNQGNSRIPKTEPGHLGLEVIQGIEAAERLRKKGASSPERSEDRKPPLKASPPLPRKS